MVSELGKGSVFVLNLKLKVIVGSVSRYHYNKNRKRKPRTFEPKIRKKKAFTSSNDLNEIIEEEFDAKIIEEEFILSSVLTDNA